MKDSGRERVGWERDEEVSREQTGKECERERERQSVLRESGNEREVKQRKLSIQTKSRKEQHFPQTPNSTVKKISEK